MNNKLTVRVECFTARCRNILRGFAMVKIEELHLLVHNIAIHTKTGQTWAQLPMRPWVKDGAQVIGADGALKFFPVLEFDDAKVRDAFSDAVIKALLEHDPHALECRGAVS